MLTSVCGNGAVRLHAVTCWRRSTPRPRDGELHRPRVLLPGCWAVPRPRHVWGKCPCQHPPFVQVQCCFTSPKTVRTARDGEPRMATSTFTQLLSCPYASVGCFYRGASGVMVLQRCWWCDGFIGVSMVRWFYRGAGGVMVL